MQKPVIAYVSINGTSGLSFCLLNDELYIAPGVHHRGD
jgi:hypothetical protein